MPTVFVDSPASPARGCVFRQEADRLLAHAPADDFFQTHESAAADEQDVGRVDRREFLMRMLAAALRRNVGDGAFQNLQQRLLHAFARNIARDRRVLVLAADLVDLVDIDDALLAALHIAVGGLQQLQDDVLDVFAHVAGFGQRGGVDDGERHIENPRQRLRHQRLAGSGRADQQDVRLRQLDLGIPHPVHVDALRMVINGHRQLPLGGLLPDHVLIQKIFYFQRLRDLVRTRRQRVPAYRPQESSCKPRCIRRRCRPADNRSGKKSASRQRPGSCGRRNIEECRPIQRASSESPSSVDCFRTITRPTSSAPGEQRFRTNQNIFIIARPG